MCLFASFGFERTIFKPTRLKRNIDNIFINLNFGNFEADIVDIDFSDHRGQRIKVEFPNSDQSTLSRISRPLTHIGFCRMHNILSDMSWDFVNHINDSNECFHMFHQCFVNVFNASFPEKTMKHCVRGELGINWFTNDLKKMRGHLQFLQELYRDFRLNEIKNLRNEFKKQYHIALVSAKKRAAENYIKNSNNKIRASWKLINNYRKTKLSTTSSISPNDFNIYFSSIASKIVKDIPNFADVDPEYKKFGSTFEFEEVTYTGIRDIVRSLKNSKSRDIYGLSVQILKRNINTLCIPLTKMLNKCIKAGMFPSDLKVAKVLPLFKDGDRNNVSSYRPISVLPIFSKLFEKVLNIQIVNYFERNKLFSDHQFGYRKDRSTGSAILRLVTHIMQGFEEGDYTVISFLDLSKAFDCVSPRILLAKLRNYGFSDNSIKLLQSYLSDRCQKVVKDDKESHIENIKLGVPQGSILGPILFLIYINDFPTSLPDTIESILFADDASLLLRGSDFDQVMEGSRDAQSTAKDWFGKNGLMLNQNKTNVLVCTLKPLDAELKHSFKFLGLYLDHKLTWDVHCEELSKRLSKNIFVIRTLSFKVSVETLLTSYHALCHSLIKYGILVWGHTPHAAKIFSLQRKVVRILDNLDYRADCRSSFQKFGILTLPSIFIFECLKFMHDKHSRALNADIHHHYTRARLDVRNDFCRLSKTQNGPNFWAYKLYNRIPHSIRNMKNQFNSVVKKYLSENAFYSIEEFLVKKIM